MALETPEPGSTEPGSLQSLRDAQLVARALAATSGDERRPVFAEISRRYYKVVLRWCSRHLYDRSGAEQDIGHEAFLDAFAKLGNGEGPPNPDRLAGWLIRFADNRLKAYVRNQGAAMRLITPSDTAFELLPDVDPDSGRKERLAETNDLVHIVVGTLTPQQQQIYQLRFVQELTGPQIASLLGLERQNASNQATIVKGLIGKGVGALVLAAEGRGRCPQLDQILEDAGFDGTNFTATLREDVVRHYDDCKICQNCPVCSVEQKKLTLPYMPVLIPMLGAVEFRERIAESIHAMTMQPQHTTRTRRRPPRQDRTRPGDHGTRPDRNGRPRRKLRARRSTWYGGTAAAAVLVLVAVLLVVPHGHAAGGTHGGTHGGSAAAIPAALTANETAAKVAAVKFSNPISAGPLLGPGGRLWTESIPATGTNATLTSTSLTTYATTTYKLPGTLGGASVTYSGSAAFDGAGHLWLTALLRTGNPSSPTYDQVLLQYTQGGGAVQQFAEDSGCATASDDDTTELYEANDGAVWVVCPANFAGGGAFFYRMTSSGGITSMKVVNNAQPGSLLYVAYTNLPFTGSGPLVQGPGGTMYGLDNGLVQLTPGGRETLAIDDKDDEPIQLVGNGSGLLEAIAVCDVNNASGEQTKQCVNKVNTDGTESTIASLPDYDGYNDSLVHWAVMDSAGNLWLILDTPGPPPIKQYYVEVSPGGAVKTFPFTVPGDTIPVQVSQAPPVITPNGGLWTPDDQDAVSATWSLVQIVPK